MKTVKISLNSIDKVKSFVNDLTKFDTDFDLVSGRYVIDAKSIMGIFSLDLSKPIDLNIHDGGNTEEILTVLAPYIIEAKEKKGCNCKGTEQLQGFKNCRNLTSGSFFLHLFLDAADHFSRLKCRLHQFIDLLIQLLFGIFDFL